MIGGDCQTKQDLVRSPDSARGAALFTTQEEQTLGERIKNIGRVSSLVMRS